MPDYKFPISALPESIGMTAGDLVEVSQVDAGSSTGYTSVKKTMTELGEELNNGILYSSGLNTTNKKVLGAINELNESRNYSTTETAVGSWIDDSVIYRKVVTGLNLTAAADTWVETTIDASSISTFIKGLVLDSSGQSYPCSLSFSNSKVAFCIPIAASSLSTLILDYIKT